MKPILTALLLPILCFALSDEDFFKVLRAKRQIDSHTAKSKVLEFDEQKKIPNQNNNGDESTFADFRGNFNKGLMHQSSGYPEPDAYKSLVKALTTGDSASFNDIKIGLGMYRLVNPQASLAFTTTAIDSWSYSIPPAPTFLSSEAAGEMVEVYWSALLRDVPFNKFSTDPVAQAAMDELSSLPVFKGPKIAGSVTSETLLRGNTPGDLVGPYISQFLYKNVPFGSTFISYEQQVPTGTTGPGASGPAKNDFNTSFEDWHTTIVGGDTGKTINYDGMKMIRTPRDLAEYVHIDRPGQASLVALLLLESFGEDALDKNWFYLNNSTQEGFVTFGIGEILNMTRTAVQNALKTAWYQKWHVNRRLRPEEYGFYVQRQMVNGDPIGLASELISSKALTRTYEAFDSYFLPLAYPEGSPVHPSYPAGHATLMGAAVTILKAFFDESYEIPDTMQPNDDNDALECYDITPLTVGGELNKLAANIALGRDHAGVHYRSDGYQGMLLGEKIAIDVLNNNSFLINEDFQGFSLTKFDGTTIKVGAKR